MWHAIDTKFTPVVIEILFSYNFEEWFNLDIAEILSLIYNSYVFTGMEIAEEDMDNIEKFIEQITSLIKRRNNMTEYLKTKMQNVAPNLAVLIGEMVN